MVPVTRMMAGKASPFAFTGLRSMCSFPNHSNRVVPPAQASNSPVKNSNVAAMFENPRLKPRRVPIQLRNTGDAGDGGLHGEGSRLLIDTRIRKGPFWHLSQEAGAWCYQVYNKTYHPRVYIKPE